MKKAMSCVAQDNSFNPWKSEKVNLGRETKSTQLIAGYYYNRRWERGSKENVVARDELQQHETLVSSRQCVYHKAKRDALGKKNF